MPHLCLALCTENERFHMELNLTRGKLDALRSISRMNQALGVLP